MLRQLSTAAPASLVKGIWIMGAPALLTELLMLSLLQECV